MLIHFIVSDVCNVLRNYIFSSRVIGTYPARNIPAVRLLQILSQAYGTYRLGRATILLSGIALAGLPSPEDDTADHCQ